MEPWRRVWRDGLAALLTEGDLEQLEVALVRDDSRLIQGAPTEPPPDPRFNDEPADGACLLGYAAMMGGVALVGQLRQHGLWLCVQIDKRLGKQAHYALVNWWDDTDRDEARAALLYEVQREQAQRSARQEVAL